MINCIFPPSRLKYKLKNITGWKAQAWEGKYMHAAPFSPFGNSRLLFASPAGSPPHSLDSAIALSWPKSLFGTLAASFGNSSLCRILYVSSVWCCPFRLIFLSLFLMMSAVRRALLGRSPGMAERREQSQHRQWGAELWDLLECTWLQLPRLGRDHA